MSVDAVRECAQFPRAKMSGEHQHAAAATRSSLIVLKPFVLNYPTDILRRNLWKLRKLRELPSKIREYPLDDGLARCGIQLRKSNLQIAIPDSSEPGMQVICSKSDQLPDADCQTPGHQTHELQNCPRGDELDQVA